MNNYNYKLVYYVILSLRFFAPLMVFTSPLLTIVLVLVLDTLDGVHASRGGIKKSVYQSVDKAFDLYWYAISLMYIFSDIQFNSFKVILFMLFAFRLLGILLYWFSGKKSILFVFANFYENIFIAIVLGVLVPQLHFLIESNFFVITVIVVVAAKIVQEYFAHLAPYSFTEKFLKIKMNWKE